MLDDFLSTVIGLPSLESKDRAAQARRAFLLGIPSDLQAASSLPPRKSTCLAGPPSSPRGSLSLAGHFQRVVRASASSSMRTVSWKFLLFQDAHTHDAAATTLRERELPVVEERLDALSAGADRLVERAGGRAPRPDRHARP